MKLSSEGFLFFKEKFPRRCRRVEAAQLQLLSPFCLITSEAFSFSSEVEVYLVDHIPIMVWDPEGF